MFGSLGLFWNLFKQGQEVADPALWKNRQVTSNSLGAVILALVAVLRYYKIDLPIDNESALLIGGGIVAVWNVILTMITSKKVGIKPAEVAAPNVPEVGWPSSVPDDLHTRPEEEIRQQAANSLSQSMSRRNKGFYDDPDTPRNDR